MNSQVKKILIITILCGALIFIVPGDANATELIKGFEVGQGNPPYLAAIPDTNGYWQIGYGSTWNYTQNRWVQQGDTISPAEVDLFLQKEIAEKKAMINQMVKVPINGNQQKALISLAYNIGSTAFQASTLLKLLNQGSPKQVVANQFDRLVYAGGQIMPGLVERRFAEKVLFLS